MLLSVHCIIVSAFCYCQCIVLLSVHCVIVIPKERCQKTGTESMCVPKNNVMFFPKICIKERVKNQHMLKP